MEDIEVEEMGEAGERENEEEAEGDKYTCKDYIFFFILIFLQGSLMTSRLYLGVHSLD
jgi:hypothetical protein